MKLVETINETIESKKSEPDSIIFERLTPLHIEKDSNKKFAIVGEVIQYTLKVVNQSENKIIDIKIYEQLEECIEFVLGSIKVRGEQWEEENIISGIKIGDLEAYEETIVQFSVKMTTYTTKAIGGKSQATYKYITEQGQLKKGWATSTEEKIKVSYPHIRIATSTNETFAVIGDRVTYTIHLINDGDTLAENIVFQDRLPKETKWVTGSFRINNQTVHQVQLDKGINLGELEPSQILTMTYQVEIADSNTQGYIRNQPWIAFEYTLEDGSLGEIGYRDDREENSVKITLGIANFKQINVESYLGIIEGKANIETINTLTGSIEITKYHVIQTPQITSVEGQRMTGNKLIIRGSLKIVMEYTSLDEHQSVHTAHYDVPFSTFIILPTDYRVGGNIHVESMIEDIYYKCLDIQNFFVNASVLIQVKIMGYS